MLRCFHKSRRTNVDCGAATSCTAENAMYELPLPENNSSRITESNSSGITESNSSGITQSRIENKRYRFHRKETAKPKTSNIYKNIH